MVAFIDRTASFIDTKLPKLDLKKFPEERRKTFNFVLSNLSHLGLLIRKGDGKRFSKKVEMSTNETFWLYRDLDGRISAVFKSVLKSGTVKDNHDAKASRKTGYQAVLLREKDEFAYSVYLLKHRSTKYTKQEKEIKKRLSSPYVEHELFGFYGPSNPKKHGASGITKIRENYYGFHEPLLAAWKYFDYPPPIENLAYTTKDFLLIFYHLASSIEEMHAKNIIHRDIKSGNVLLKTEKGVDGYIHVAQAYLTDFDAALLIDEATGVAEVAEHRGFLVDESAPPEFLKQIQLFTTIKELPETEDIVFDFGLIDCEKDSRPNSARTMESASKKSIESELSCVIASDTDNRAKSSLSGSSTSTCISDNSHNYITYSKGCDCYQLGMFIQKRADRYKCLRGNEALEAIAEGLLCEDETKRWTAAMAVEALKKILDE